MKSKKWIFIVGIVLAVLIALAVVKFNKSSEDKYVNIKQGDLIEASYAVGTVRAEQIYKLKVGASSRVIERYVRVGDRVSKGDKLILLDGFSIYRAPFSGIVTSIEYEVGELVFAQSNVLTLINDRSLKLELSMDERVISSVKIGQAARISFENQRDKLITGKVRSIYANEGEFLVIIDFEHAGISLMPGMTSDVAIEVNSHKNVHLLPMGTVKDDESVDVLKNGKLKSITPKFGANDGSYIIIEDDSLSQADQVLLPKTKRSL